MGGEGGIFLYFFALNSASFVGTSVHLCFMHSDPAGAWRGKLENMNGVD